MSQLAVIICTILFFVNKIEIYVFVVACALVSLSCVLSCLVPYLVFFPFFFILVLIMTFDVNSLGWLLFFQIYV